MNVSVQGVLVVLLLAVWPAVLAWKARKRLAIVQLVVSGLVAVPSVLATRALLQATRAGGYEAFLFLAMLVLVGVVAVFTTVYFLTALLLRLFGGAAEQG